MGEALGGSGTRNFSLTINDLTIRQEDFYLTGRCAVREAEFDKIDFEAAVNGKREFAGDKFFRQFSLVLKIVPETTTVRIVLSLGLDYWLLNFSSQNPKYQYIRIEPRFQ